MIPGFASAERAWENANPYDDECTCEAEAYTCDECGHTDGKKGLCPESDCDSTAEFMRTMTTEEVAEHFPSQKCPKHGWCTGCASRNCEDCNG